MITETYDYFFLLDVAAAAFLFSAAERMIYQSAPVRNTEEKPPATIPTIRGMANSLMDATPRIYNEAMVRKVVSEV